jgi:Fe-S-cluster containining protein
MTGKQASRELNLLYPEGINYSCQGCGRCCGGWSVGMTEEDYSRVKDVNWQSLHEQLAGKEVFFHREAEFKAGLSAYPHYTKPTKEGNCPFLVDNLCFIHSQLGAAAKPVACQIFPYAFAQTPSGIYTSVFFTSMAAVRNIGEPLAHQKETLTNYFELSLHQHLVAMNEEQKAQWLKTSEEAKASGAETLNVTPFDQVALTPTCKLTWLEYKSIEDKAIEIILEQIKDPASGNIFKTLLSLGELYLSGLKLKVQGKEFSAIADFKPSNQISDLLLSNVEQMTLRMMFYRFFIYPQARRGDTRQWQMQKSEALKGKNAQTVFSLFTKFAASGLETILFAKANLEKQGVVNLEKALLAPMEPIDEEVSLLFHRWLYLKIFSKTYFGPAAAGFSVLSGLNNLTAALLSVILYGKARAMQRGAKSFAISDLYEAHWLLDRELLTLAQVPEQESRIYNSGLSAPRLFNKACAVMGKSFGY